MVELLGFLFYYLVISFSVISCMRYFKRRRNKSEKSSVTETQDLNYYKFKYSDYKYASGNNYNETFEDKGNLGEFLIFHELEPLKIIKMMYVNAYIPKYNGTSEVDLIMVTEYGIYVFESKNYGGWIYGNENDSYWKQVFNKNSEFEFFNPILQNNNHIFALNELLNMGNEEVYKSFIVFNDRCILKDIPIKNKKVKVINRKELISVLMDDINNSEKVLSINQIKYIDRKLKPHILASNELKEQHIKRIQEAKDIRAVEKVMNDRQSVCRKCPKCNSKLMIKITRNGVNKGSKFYGCANFPKCNHTENM